MIIVRLIGGLGNQMFQYAAARRLAYHRNVPLSLDASGFEEYPLHKYGLHNFNIIERFASSRDVCGFKYRKTFAGKVAGLFLRFVGPSRAFSLVKEKGLPFNHKILSKGDSVYLDGYWQSEKYFKDAEDVIRRDFTFKHEPDSVNCQALNQITTCNAVSLHIRRGDYVSNPVTNSIHGTIPMEYYRAAIRIVSSRMHDARFFLFTDDVEWASRNMCFDCPVSIMGHNNADKNYEDLRLMSLCKHNIIANSSFSWWGAWLNNNPGKICIAPKKWFNVQDLDTKDLVPDGWLRI